MIKKIMCSMAAIAMLFVASCQKSEDFGGNAGETALVSFSVNTPEMGRSFSDGASATVLQYAVYEDGVELSDLTVTNGEIHGSTTVEMQLTTGNTYSVIFWAAAPDAPYTVDLTNKKMTVDYTNAVSNAENRDAFYKYEEFTVSGNGQLIPIKMTRPFAQLNIGTDDFEAAKKSGYEPTKSMVTVSKIYDTLNLETGAVTGETDVTFDYAAIPQGETFPVAGEYEYLAMNYLLVEKKVDAALIEVEFGYTETDATAAKTRTVGSVPVNRNHRTNIYGSLLTSKVNINVEILPGYDDPAYEADALHKAALNGGVVTLTDDVVLTSPLEVYGEMTINLNGKTISNPSNYAIENYANLTITGDGDMQGLGGIRSHGGKVTIEGGNFTCSSNWSNGTYNHILKAVNTEVVINGGTFDATVGGTNNAMINVSENAVVTINGGTFKNVNGVIPQFAPYMFTYEKNGKLIINGGDFYGGWRFNGEATTTDIYGGTFAVSYDGQSFHAASTHVLTIYGGVFSLANGAKLNPANHLAAGKTVVEKDGLYYVVAETVANSAEELIAAVSEVAEGGVITLTDNVTFTTENRTHNSASYYDGIYFVGSKNFTIDLGGKTINNEEGAVNDYLLNFKNDGSEPCTITIKNGTLDAGTAAFCAICTSSTSTAKITINLEKVNIINNISNGSTIKVRGGAELNVKSGTVITGKNSYLGIECVASTVNIYDGAKIYMNGTSSYLGCLVGACGNGVVNVYGGYGKGVKGGFVAMTSGGTINIAGGEWIANTDGTVGNNSNVYVLTAQNNKYESGYKGASIINITGGTFRGGMDAWILNDVKVEKAELNIKGGNFNANPSNYLVDGATATETNGIWTVK